MKLVIIGNSGSGKTSLARRLAAGDATSIIHLDELFWAPGGFTEKRSAEEVAVLIGTAKARDTWIAEGVFGKLAAAFLDEADALIWLNPGWPACQQRLSQRAAESASHMGRQQSADDLEKLLAWAAAYSSRDNDCSHKGHQDLFDTFAGARLYLDNLAPADALADAVRHNPAIAALRLAAETRT